MGIHWLSAQGKTRGPAAFRASGTARAFRSLLSRVFSASFAGGFFSRARVYAAALVLCCLCLPLLAGPALAAPQNITYIGDGSNGVVLQNAPAWAGGGAGSLFPGSTASPEASSNQVTINYVPGGGMTNPNRVFGGLSENSIASGNRLTLTNGDVTAMFFMMGGSSINQNAESNVVSISGGTARDVYGGSSSFANAVSNAVTLSGGSAQAIYGGYSGGGRATGNAVNISNGTVTANVYGGYVNAGTGNAEDNIVNVTGGTFTSGTAAIYGGQTVSGEALRNQVAFNNAGATVQNVSGGYSTSGNVTGNSVTFSAGTVTGGVEGGHTSNGGSATGNSVTVTGGSIYLTAGGFIGSGAGDATGNSLTVTGGQVDYVNGGSTLSGNASGNIVTITGGIIREEANGGLTTSGGNAINNTVNFGGTADLSAAIIRGGIVVGAGDARTGNTLNVKNSGMTAKGIQNFANYNFYLPTTMTAGQTMLTVSQGDGAGGVADISGSVIGVGIDGQFSALKNGDRVTLINSATGLDAAGINSRAVGLQGIARLYDFDLTFDVNNLFATAVGGAQINPQLKSLSEGRLAGLAFVNQGADLIIGPGMYSALLATQRQGYGLAPFATLSGGTSRYDTGSHINVDGFSMITGLAWRAPLEERNGSFLAGAFFEAGWGNYDSHNSFDSLPSVKGDGDTSYYGGGILARYERPVGPGGLYGEASFRAGHVSTDFSSNDIGLPGTKSDYDSGSAYYGAHAGLGYIWSITDKASLDFSTKYIWTHEDSDSVTVAGDRISFKAADSQRWRSGARFSYAVSTESGAVFTPYAGAYYDHEFDGRAKASAYGLNIDAPDLKGGTGVGELGLTWKPAPASGFAVDLGVQGYTGVRQGVTGSFQLKYEF